MRLPLALMLAPILALAAAPVQAHEDDDHDHGHDHDHEWALRLREGGTILPLEELLRRLGLGKDVRILEIETELEHGRAIYEIEYLEPGGRVREVLIDPSTGEVLGEEDD